MIDPGIATIDPEAVVRFFLEYRKGRYQIEAVVGNGGMGMVFRAGDSQLERYVAIKVLHPDLLADEGVTKRFGREAKIMTQIVHPAIVRVYDSDMVYDTVPCIFLEWVDGGSLWKYVTEHGPMAPSMALHVMSLVCEGIEYAHAQGVIHRDIKPDNILLDPKGYPKVTDFGIAVRQQDDGETRMTQTGMQMGTTGFMAPEQMNNASEATVRSDVHGLGVTLWSILKRKMPCNFFSAAIIAEDSDMLDGISEELGSIIKKAVQINQSDRYASVAEFRLALKELLDSGQLEDAGTIVQSGKPQVRLLPIPEGATRLKYVKPEEESSAHVFSPLSVVPIPVPPGVETMLRQQGQQEDQGPDMASKTQFEYMMEEVNRRNRVRVGIMVGFIALLMGAFIGYINLPKESSQLETSVSETVVKPSEKQPAETVSTTPKLRRSAELILFPCERRELDETISLVMVPLAEETSKTGSVVPVIKDKITTGTVQKKPIKKPVKNLEETKTVEVLENKLPIPVVTVEKIRVNVSFPEGDSFNVWLVGPKGRHKIPGSVEPGTYKVVAAFSRGERTAIPTLNVQVGKSIKLICKSDFESCSVP